MRALLLATALCAVSAPAFAATLTCTVESGFDWYTNPDIRLSQDFDPEAGAPVLEIETTTGAYTDRFVNRVNAHRGGVLAVLQQGDKATKSDFVGWDASNRVYLTARVWVEGMPFMFADGFGDAFGGHCVETP